MTTPPAKTLARENQGRRKWGFEPRLAPAFVHPLVHVVVHTNEASPEKYPHLAPLAVITGGTNVYGLLIDLQSKEP